jgi:hypothetical protein
MRTIWLGQGTQHLETYEVGNLLQGIGSAAQNQRDIDALVKLSQGSPDQFSAILGSDGVPFLSLSLAVKTNQAAVDQFRKEFSPPGSKNEVDPGLYKAVNMWLDAQKGLSDILQKHANVSGDVAPAAAADEIAPGTVFLLASGGALVLGIIGYVIFK